MSAALGSIAGRVLGPAGAPVAGATVAVVASSRPHRDIAAVTGGDGAFHFGGLVPGDYRLEARSRDVIGAAQVAVAAGAPSTVEIRLDE